MGAFITILFMVAIGAIIGGVTNSLAIKMLFRPYNPVYIRNWRVPFTPGLIPKRRADLAIQLGRLVVNHLLTPESFRKKLLNDTFQQDISSFVQNELRQILTTEKTPVEILRAWGIENSQEKLQQKVDSFIDHKYDQLLEKYRERELKDILSPGMITKINGKLPDISSYILQKGIDYFESEDGKSRIEKMVNDFIKNRSGMLGNMLQMLAGNVNLADKLQPEIIKFLRNEGTKELVSALLQREWEKVLAWKVQQLEEQFEKKNLAAMVKRSVNKVLKVDEVMNTPISQLTASYHETVLATVPKGVSKIGEWLSARIEVIMKRLRLAEIVQEQVEQFPVERLEEMILSIIRKELKMITYLGALLGGLIGVFQGLIAVFF